MEWKTLPYWLKGALIGLIISIIVSIIFGALNYCWYPLISGVGSKSCGIVYSAFAAIFAGIFIIIPFLGVGALIGFIIGKIKAK